MRNIWCGSQRDLNQCRFGYYRKNTSPFVYNWPIAALFFVIFILLPTSIQVYKNKIKIGPPSIWYRGSNSRPLDRMTPPIITRPRLPPVKLLTACIQNTKSCHNQSDSRKKISLQRLFVAKSVRINALLLTLNEFLELSSKWSIL